MQPRFSFVPVSDHEIHVTEWGDPRNTAIVMWHGLARTGRDFDELASALSDEFYVLCPDTIGRGLSSWSHNPKAEYSIEFYTGIAADLLDYYEIDRAGWIGTSMGGLIGMHMASGPLVERLNWLIVNDIAPEIPRMAIERIINYAGQETHFASLSTAEKWFRETYAPFGPASDCFWRRMTRTSVRRDSNGNFLSHYDPRITIQFTASCDELTSWDRYESIRLPLHIIRGEMSDLVSPKLAERMHRTGPKPKITQINGCGHAPTLSGASDISKVRNIIGELQSD